MEVARNILVLLLLSSLGTSALDWSYREEFGNSYVVYKSQLIFFGSEEYPILTLGSGTFQATDNQGNFNIDDVETLSCDFFVQVATVVGESSLQLQLVSEECQECEVVLSFGQNHVSIDVSKSNFGPYDFNHWYLRIAASDDEYVWGGGAQYSFFNLREGGTYPIWTREQGVGRNKSSTLTQLMDLVGNAGGDYHTTYWPHTTYLSSRGYHLESTFPAYSELRLVPKGEDTSRGHVLYWHHTPNKEYSCYTCKIYITAENSLMETVQKINPGQPELPEWVYNGAIIGVQGGTQRMLDIMSQALNSGVKVSAMWIQDWSGKITTEFGTRVFWNWKWNSTWYPELDQVIKDIDEQFGVKVTAYITPHLNIEGDVFQENSQENVWLTNEVNEVLSQDFGQFNVSTVDIIRHDPGCNCINPARIWYKDLIKANLLDLGLAGWMADFGEYTPMNAQTEFDGRWWGPEYPEILHNILPQDWASLNREAITEAGKLGEILYWMRSGGQESRFHQVMNWAGDQTVDWTFSDGLPSSIVAALSLAVSGMGLSHSDIGGYTSISRSQLGDLAPIRDEELLLRWAEYSAFTPIMRTHETNLPDENVQVYDNVDILTKFGRLTQIYNTLKPYIKNAVRQNAEFGTPVMRPLFLQYQGDADAYRHDYQYMFGDDLLVAPVLQPGVDTWDVYVPGPDDWRWLWNDAIGTDTGGLTFNVPAQVGSPPVFYRSNSEYKDLFKEIARLYG